VGRVMFGRLPRSCRVEVGFARHGVSLAGGDLGDDAPEGALPGDVGLLSVGQNRQQHRRGAQGPGAVDESSELGFERGRSVLGEPPGDVAERDWLCRHAGEGSARAPLTVADAQSQSIRVSVGAGSSRFGDETGTGRVDPKLVLV
ncbi:MAG TPA: hypothetical protein VE466_09915, partial [Acidimicrobiales bacterium]|nr:hypothetical protein [Acidimicrobiales bacterium]